MSADVITFSMWVALMTTCLLSYWLLLMLVFGLLIRWQDRRRRVHRARDQYERALARIEERSAIVVRHLANQFDAAREEIRRQGRQQ